MKPYQSLYWFIPVVSSIKVMVIKQILYRTTCARTSWASGWSTCHRVFRNFLNWRQLVNVTFVNMTIVSKNINDTEIFLRKFRNKMQVFPICFIYTYSRTFLWARESVGTSTRTVGYFWEIIAIFDRSERNKLYQRFEIPNKAASVVEEWFSDWLHLKALKTIKTFKTELQRIV